MAEVNGATRGDRKLYKIIRGSYSRREGFSERKVDPVTGKAGKRVAQPFVHYSARTTRNPAARDEVYLTDAEANAFGRHNLRSMHTGDNVTTDPAKNVDSLMDRDLPADRNEAINMLIEEGQLVRKNRQLDRWRKRVFEAQIFTTELPNKRLEIIELLQRTE